MTEIACLAIFLVLKMSVSETHEALSEMIYFSVGETTHQNPMCSEPICEEQGDPMVDRAVEPKSQPRSRKQAAGRVAPKPRATREVAASSSITAVTLGPRLKHFRLRNEWTLEQTAQLTGVARSTLSKIEKGVMSPTFDILQKIAHGMQLDIVEFFDAGAHSAPSGRRSITRKGQGRPLESPMYRHEALSTELARKRLLPFATTIKAQSLAEFGPLMKHSGEVFLYVLSGRVRVHTELYEESVLEGGDSIYFDSGLAHALTRDGEEEARAIWVCSEEIDRHS